MASILAAPDADDAASATIPASLRTPTAGESAWIAALPCALVTIAAIVTVGPPFGRAFLSPGSAKFWPAVPVIPEPAEHGRYMVALAGALLLAIVVLVLARRPLRLYRWEIRALVVVSQLLTAIFVIGCLLAQHGVLFRAYIPPQIPDKLFTVPTLAVATAFALLFLASARVRGIGARHVRETRLGGFACIAIAAGLTAVWLLTAINTDGTAGNALGNNLIPWDASETFAVLDGRTPLVNFHAQYSQLWPFLAAAILALTGSATLTAWTTTMATVSGLALLAIYAMLRRIVRSSVLALAIYLPFMATGFFIATKPLENRFSPAGMFSIWPLRYAGPYLLAWLTARHVAGAAPRRAWLLLTAAGLVAINNAEFGIGAFAATLAALACTELTTAPRGTRRFASNVVGGLLGAALLTALLTLVRAGGLPHLGWVLEFSRIYGIEGWILEPMPWIGFHMVLYVTFVAAIATAAVRIVQREREPALTGMLAWSGVFGLLAASYYVGRSDVLSLISMLSAWCLALTLLLIAVIRNLARTRRRPGLGELAVLFGFALAICSLAQLPTPWGQIARLHRPTPTPAFKQVEATRFVAGTTAPGERVGIAMMLGHRIAYDAGVVNVAPYAGVETMPTVQQLQRTIDDLRASHARKLFVAEANALEHPISSEQLEYLRKAGFTVVHRETSVTELIDKKPGS